MTSRPRTTGSRLAAVATGLLAVLLLTQALDADMVSVRLLEVVVLLGATAGGAKMWFHNCFESRMVVVLTLVATAAGALLSLTIGMPGVAVAEPGLANLALLGLCGVIAGLMAVDARERRTRRGALTPPYAL